MVVFAIHQHESITCVHVSPHPEPPFHLPPHPSGLSQSTNFGCPASCIQLGTGPSVLHMVIYMFQCCSLKSSHSRLLPQSSKVCSLYLCLFCCLMYRVIQSKFSSCNLENRLKQKCPDLEQEAQCEGNWSNSGKKW